MTNELISQYIDTPNKTVNVIGGIVYARGPEEDKIGIDEKGNPVYAPEITIEQARETDYIDGKGYIDKEGYIWIFCLNKPAKACRNEYPYFWKNLENDLEFSNPTEEIRDAYAFERMSDLSKVSIIQQTEDNEQLFDEEEINDVNAATSFYVPLLKSSDDFLKKVIKASIIKKGIDINRLKVKTEQKYVLPNMRSVLDNETKMSTVNFLRWMDLLGLSFTIIIENDGSDTDLLKNPIIYQSHRDSLGELINGEVVDLVTGAFVMDQDENEEE